MAEERERKVVLADDHTVVLAGLRKALEDIPNLTIVAEARDGPSLFEALERHHPDIVLLDINMPNFDPLEDTRRIRETFPDVRILVVSAYDDEVYVQGLLQLGIHGYHLKDQPLSDLCLAVQRVLGGDKWVCSPVLEKLVVSSQREGIEHLIVRLSRRQREILALLAEGLDNHGIARQLGLSVKTVENHLTRLYRLLGVSGRIEAVRLVHEHAHLFPSTPQPRALRPVIPAEERLKVLIVDDNPRYCRQLHLMIRQAMHHAVVYEAHSLEEALETAKCYMPHLAFVDVILRGQDGIGGVRRLVATVPGIRVVLITAYPDREFRRQGLQAGATAFVDKKDLDLTALRHILEDALATVKSASL